MGKIKSLGIGLLGAYILLLGGYFFVSSVPLSISKFPAYILNNEFSAIERTVGIFQSSIGVLAITGYMISGVFLIFHKEWARLMAIISGVIIFAELIYLTIILQGEIYWGPPIFFLVIFGVPTLFLLRLNFKGKPAKD